MNNIFIGVDPGKSGFITIYNPSGDFFEFIPMPEQKVPTGKVSKTGKSEMKSEFSVSGFRDLILDIHTRYKGSTLHAVIEEVNGRQGWSAQNNFAFGHTAGIQMLTLVMLGAKITEVRPIKWQTSMYQGFSKVMIPSSTGKTMIHDTKATSAIVSAALRPELDFRKTTRSKNVDDNKTDSFLMCLYGYKEFQKNN
jgi:hypothetical protein